MVRLEGTVEAADRWKAGDGQGPRYRVERDRVDHLIIRDIGPHDQHLTVTNGAEAVVEKLLDRLEGRRLLYWDTEKELTELVIKDGKFAGFRHAPTPKEN